MKPVRILLDPEQSFLLSDAGTNPAASVRRTKSGRWVLSVIPRAVGPVTESAKVKILTKKPRPKKP